MVKIKECQEWLFTEPYEQIYTKRGDALGWSDIADKYSDMLVPGLSKRTYDARWITILSWCLVESNNAQLDEIPNTLKWQRRRYEWLRPLELMWIALTLNQFNLNQDNLKGRQLPQRRAVTRWLSGNTKTARVQNTNLNFGLSNDQWMGYRYTGIYGAYRVAFKKLPGLTKDGDGWTPDTICIKLADFLGNELDRIDLLDGKITGNSKPETYWFNKIWSEWDGDKSKSGKDIFPASSENMKSLTKGEQKYLIKALFSEDPDGERRDIVAKTIGEVKTGKYLILCSKIAKALKNSEDGNDLSLLEHFSQFSDSAIDVFIEIMRNMPSGEEIEIKELLKDNKIKKCIGLLKKAANDWKTKRDEIGNNTKIEYKQVDELALKISKENVDKINTLSILIHHHLDNGGGRKWFNLTGNGNLVKSILSDSEYKPSYYRFRLWQLARMAVQCGIIEKDNLPAVLYDEVEIIEEDNYEK